MATFPFENGEWRMGGLMTGTISTVSQTNEDTRERKLSQPENVLNEDDVD